MKAFSLLLLSACTWAARFTGVANSADKGYQFIGKFVFNRNSDASKKNMIMQFSGGDPNGYELWIFDDQPNHWPEVYAKNMACDEARTHTSGYNTSFTNDNIKQMEFNVPIEYGIVQKYMRQWFIAVANCKPGTLTKDIKNISYDLHFINPTAGSYDQEFGMNTSGLQTLYIVFFCIYFPFTCIHFYGVVGLSKKLQYLHPMVRLFALVILLQLVSITAHLAYWGTYISAGNGPLPALIIAESLDIIQRSIFILILMLLAKGWTISGDEVPGKKIVGAIIFSFFACDTLILVWKWLINDPASPDLAAVIKIFLAVITGIWLCFSVWFAITIFKSFKNEDNPVKKTLYRNLMAVYLPWFFGLPLVNLLTVFLGVISSERIVQSVSVIVQCVGSMILSYLLWPSRAEEYFSISTPDVMKAQIDTYEQL